jgi:putative transposase
VDEDRRKQIALFRYALIREAAEPALTPAERGLLLRRLVEADHLGPGGERVRVSRPTLDRWIRAWRAGGFEALRPAGRNSLPRTPAETLALAEKLKREAPRRTAAHVAAIVAETLGGTPPSARTLERHFARLGLGRRSPSVPMRVYGRFEAEHPNDLWTGDALHGPAVASRKTYLFAFIDDASRLVPGYRFGLAEDVVRLEAAFRTGLASRGVPKAAYVDNGSPFASKELLRACAVLGIRLIHSTPGEPAGRGKIERFFRTVRDQFLVEVEARGVADLAELNRLFGAWVEGVYHRRVHSETGEAPVERFLRDGPPALPTPEVLREAFLWSAWRTVTKTATVSLLSNTYEVDAHLAGQKVELIFNPFDLARIEVRFRGRRIGLAVPHRIGRHTHPRVRPEPDPAGGEAPRSGIDYLGLVQARFEQETRRRISYSDIAGGGEGGTHDHTSDSGNEEEVR